MSNEKQECLVCSIGEHGSDKRIFIGVFESWADVFSIFDIPHVAKSYRLGGFREEFNGMNTLHHKDGYLFLEIQRLNLLKNGLVEGVELYE